MSEGGFGGGVLGASTSIGSGVVAGAAVTQTGLLPQTGPGMSLLMVVTISAAIAIIVSLISSKIAKRNIT